MHKKISKEFHGTSWWYTCNSELVSAYLSRSGIGYTMKEGYESVKFVGEGNGLEVKIKLCRPIFKERWYPTEPIMKLKVGIKTDDSEEANRKAESMLQYLSRPKMFDWYW